MRSAAVSPRRPVPRSGSPPRSRSRSRLRSRPGTSFGGSAPFTASVSASTSQGTDDNLSEALITASEIAPVARPIYLSVPASETDVSSGTVTWGWANASLTFNGTGTYLVEVHLDDALGDPELHPVGRPLCRAPARRRAPLSISTLTQVPFAGTPVDFLGSASGTPGPYNFSWHFGDGAQSFDAGPTLSHLYRSPVPTRRSSPSSTT